MRKALCGQRGTQCQDCCCGPQGVLLRSSPSLPRGQLVKYHPPPRSNDRFCLTTDPWSDCIFPSDPRSDLNFFSYFGKIYQSCLTTDPRSDRTFWSVRTALFGPASGRTATLVIVRLGGYPVTKTPFSLFNDKLLGKGWEVSCDSIKARSYLLF